METKEEMLKRAGVLRFQADRVSVPETREKFLSEAKELEKSAKHIEHEAKESPAKEKKEHKGKKSFAYLPKLPSISGKTVSKSIIKPSGEKVVLRVHLKPMGLQKMDRDKSRFFKETFEQEKRSLFFK